VAVFAVEARPWAGVAGLVLTLGCAAPSGPHGRDGPDGGRAVAGRCEARPGRAFGPGPASRVDARRLAEAFADAGYAPPDGTHLLVAREVSGDPGRFEWLSLGATGFSPSPGRFWPASTVKVAAAVAALETVGRHGLTGAAHATFVDDDGPHVGTVRALAVASVRVSSNTAYNRTVLIAGFDRLNDVLLPRWGLLHTVLQRRYTRSTDVRHLRRSPPIELREGGRRVALPERIGEGRHPACPDDGNCTTLFDLLSVMRRVVLHFELPPGERFAIAPSDADALRLALLTSGSRMARGARAALGDVVVYNKTGTVVGDDRLDHGLVLDLSTGRRYLLALSIPWHGTTNGDAEELARMALVAASAGP